MTQEKKAAPRRNKLTFSIAMTPATAEKLEQLQLAERRASRSEMIEIVIERYLSEHRVDDYAPVTAARSAG